jgi:hypothetical protein
MPRRVQVEWAKEEVMCGIDAQFTKLHEDGMLDALDDEMELLKQRNRVARFLGMPERTFI